MSKIKKERPLSSHTKLRYDECYAKIVLQNIFPEQFCDLKLKDKPDLQSEEKSIGIEVTMEKEQKTKEAERLYLQLLSCTDPSKRQRILGRIEQCGAKLEGGILRTQGKDNFDLINEAVQEKNKKLQGEYALFQEYHLFIFSSIYADDSMLQDELAHLQSIHVENFWKKIYILVPGELYCFTFEKATYEKFAITSNAQNQYALQARRMVKEGERDDKTR